MIERVNTFLASLLTLWAFWFDGMGGRLLSSTEEELPNTVLRAAIFGGMYLPLCSDI